MLGVFFERQRQGEEEPISTIDVEAAVQVMREFYGFSGIAARAGQRRQGDGVARLK
jgi:hypothetical protein